MKTDNEFLELIYEKQTAYRRRRRERRQVLAASATVTLCVAAAVATVILSPRTSQPSIGISNGTTATVTDEEPVTTTTEPITLGTGGSGDYDYSWAYKDDWSVSRGISDLVIKEVYETWEAEFEFMGGTRPQHEFNTYNLIRELHIPREAVEEFCEWYEQRLGHPYFVNEKAIDAFYTYTPEEVHAYFAMPHSLLIGTRAFSPRWLVEHSVEDYKEAGITAEILEQSLQKVISPCTAEQAWYIKRNLAIMRNEPIPPKPTTQTEPIYTQFETQFQGETTGVITTSAAPSLIWITTTRIQGVSQVVASTTTMPSLTNTTATQTTAVF